jgi:hypothetical protein
MSTRPPKYLAIIVLLLVFAFLLMLTISSLPARSQSGGGGYCSTTCDTSGRNCTTYCTGK